ncbi:hypothetical protein [Pseudobacteriovorax antillogorgiicola]|uniref:YtkA-like n=1 Tax=Pseudobacteriovorax antillogorgiicola TaxID=1513793 RepID=A0A1Y6BGP8_9BACT|nr:hypothetical protein [Pseudobacteriovorax antillogorgiicola]TCS56184.1 hypothetical protein EDD56_1046 [Pseudobacteriovorax antillogorgiicola]SMF08911.1 hypothetical protein SAMN06296036_104328 [Pseudobacteriovorax antillogorgiicola]
MRLLNFVLITFSFFLQLACGGSSSDDESQQTELVGDTTLFISSQDVYKVEAQWSKTLVPGRDGVAGNFVVLSFFTKAGEPADSVDLQSNLFVPVMLTMGHGNSDKNHKVLSPGDQAHVIRVENIYFNMADQGQHSWSIRLTATVNGVEDTVTLAVPKVQDVERPKVITPEGGTLSDAGLFHIVLHDASNLEAQKDGRANNKVEFMLFDAEGLPLKNFKIETIEPWMYMNNRDHGNFDDDHTLRFMDGMAHHGIIENIFFPMASEMTMNGETRVMGRWVLKISLTLNGEADSVELDLPKVL